MAIIWRGGGAWIPLGDMQCQKLLRYCSATPFRTSSARAVTPQQRLADFIFSQSGLQSPCGAEEDGRRVGGSSGGNAADFLGASLPSEPYDLGLVRPLTAAKSSQLR